MPPGPVTPPPELSSPPPTRDGGPSTPGDRRGARRPPMRARLHTALAAGDVEAALGLLIGLQAIGAQARTTAAGRRVVVRAHRRLPGSDALRRIAGPDLVALATACDPAQRRRLAAFLTTQDGDPPPGLTRAHATALCRLHPPALRQWAIRILHRLPPAAQGRAPAPP